MNHANVHTDKSSAVKTFWCSSVINDKNDLNVLANNGLPIFCGVQQSGAIQTHPYFYTRTLEDGRGSFFSKSPILFFFFHLMNFEIKRDFDTALYVFQWKGRVQVEFMEHRIKIPQLIHLRELGIKAESGLFGFIRFFKNFSVVWCCRSFLVLTVSPRAGCGRNRFPVSAVNDV